MIISYSSLIECLNQHGPYPLVRLKRWLEDGLFVGGLNKIEMHLLARVHEVLRGDY